MGFTLKDNPSNYVTDIVTNVERIKFADSSLALDLDINAALQLYHEVAAILLPRLRKDYKALLLATLI